MILTTLLALSHQSLPLQPDARAVLRDRSPGPWRATVAQIDRYELIAGRQTFSPGETEPFDVVAVAADEARVWVTDDYEDVRLLVAVPYDELALRLLDRTQLAATAEDVETGLGGSAWLAGGTPVQVVEPAGPLAVRVRWEEPALIVEGWAPLGAFGAVWVHDPFQGAADASTLQRLDPSQPLALHTDIAGPAFAVLQGPYARVRPAGPAEGAWRPIEVVTDHARVVGWVPSALVEDAGRSLWGYGSGGGTRGATDVEWVELPAGTWLYREGHPIGRTLADTRQILVKAGDLTTITVDTRWGYVDAELPCSRHRKAKDPTASYRCE